MLASTVAIDFARCSSLRHVPSSAGSKKRIIISSNCPRAAEDGPIDSRGWRHRLGRPPFRMSQQMQAWLAVSDHLRHRPKAPVTVRIRTIGVVTPEPRAVGISEPGYFIGIEIEQI